MRITEDSRVVLYPLSVCYDDGWLAGRPDTGTFVQLPAEGAALIRALQEDPLLGAACRRVAAEHGDGLDCADFAETLVGLGFVASIDGVPCGEPAKPPSLRWLKARHVRWLLHPATAAAWAAIVAAGLVAGFSTHSLVPVFTAYFVTSWQGVNVALNVVTAIVAIALHETAHLAVARAEGVHARWSLGTRLQFLVAQTTVAGLWIRPRKARARVYLAGLAMDLFITSICLLLLASGTATGFSARLLHAVVLGQCIAVFTQFALYMRTDVYFVLQDLVRCRNLYHDAGAYARHLLRRSGPDPTLEIPPRERLPVRLYAVVMALGTLVSLALYGFYTIPILVTKLARALAQVASGLSDHDLLRIADGLAVLIAQAAIQFLYFRTLAAKHRGRTVVFRHWIRGRWRSARGRYAGSPSVSR